MYTNYVNYLKKSYDLNAAISVLHWDMETKMPVGGAAIRGSQLATLTSMLHERSTSSEYADILKSLKDNPNLTFDQRGNINDSWKDYERSVKFSSEFVEKLSLQENRGVNIWKKAITHLL